MEAERAVSKVHVPAFGPFDGLPARPPAPTADELDAEECIHGIWPQSCCTSCNGRARALEQQDSYRYFPAKYDGHCHGCNLPITVGQMVAWCTNKTKLITHQGCES